MADAAWLSQGHGFKDLWDPAETGESDESEDTLVDQWATDEDDAYDPTDPRHWSVDPWTADDSPERWGQVPW